ncbi:thiamine-phosphate kinase [Vibrio hangzhouensis]|uniref:Thiamine-monophosphate kinase n=1 Tax=Vibrio hangzhouensis TaxID=462991 RepID=A0A1H6B4Q5_9VIBR|nr:thiamine-phosphate kinase [Vibrio hangzhouensis]SEG55187.1 thiamine-phosphate kinase [Vibrio hangzhouensis]
MAGEFSLIDKYFAHRQQQRKDVILAQGDDCAIVAPASGTHIAISTDTLVSGTHFLADADPAWIAHKALASNISDLAAMGASPCWVSMGISLPEVDEPWLERFCQAFFELADYYGVQLIGGDTTRGPLAITLTVQGSLPEGKALTRSGASVGDWIYVTGSLGDAKAGLDVILEKNISDDSALNKELERRHFESVPRVLAGLALRDVASAAIDISDGLISDLGHILKRSNVGARVDVAKLPLSTELRAFIKDDTQARQYALTSGEEYELCFTVPEANRGQLEVALVNTPFTCIGQITGTEYLELHENEQTLNWQLGGFDHFKVNQ